jgi:hypothetical protein
MLQYTEKYSVHAILLMWVSTVDALACFSPVMITQRIQGCENLKEECCCMNVDTYYVDMCSVIQVKIKVDLLQSVKSTIPRTHVWHKIISKRSS